MRVCFADGFTDSGCSLHVPPNLHAEALRGLLQGYVVADRIEKDALLLGRRPGQVTPPVYVVPFGHSANLTIDAALVRPVPVNAT